MGGVSQIFQPEEPRLRLNGALESAGCQLLLTARMKRQTELQERLYSQESEPQGISSAIPLNVFVAACAIARPVLRIVFARLSRKYSMLCNDVFGKCPASNCPTTHRQRYASSNQPKKKTQINTQAVLV